MEGEFKIIILAIMYVQFESPGKSVVGVFI